MKILVITQNDKFYLYEPLAKLVRELLELSCDVHFLILSDGITGKKQSKLKKVKEIINIFGLKFFMYYLFKLIMRKLKKKSVRNLCEKKSIPFSVATDINSIETVSNLTHEKYDLFVSITATQIFRQQLLKIPRLGTLNLHTSKLPQYRGVMPTFWVLKNGENETAVSVFWVDEGIDSGPIFTQYKVAIDNRIQSELIRITKDVGIQAVIDSICKIKKGNLSTMPNDNKMATYYKHPSRVDVRVFLEAGNRFF